MEWEAKSQIEVLEMRSKDVELESKFTLKCLREKRRREVCWKLEDINSRKVLSCFVFLVLFLFCGTED